MGALRGFAHSANHILQHTFRIWPILAVQGGEGILRVGRELFRIFFRNCLRNFWDAGKPLSNPIALRKAKIVFSFGLSECNRVNLQCLFQ